MNSVGQRIFLGSSKCLLICVSFQSIANKRKEIRNNKQNIVFMLSFVGAMIVCITRKLES